MKVVIIQEDGRAIARWEEQEDGQWKQIDQKPHEMKSDTRPDEGELKTDEVIDEIVAVLM